ncbi:hypothetical protein GW17_00060407, partial [Ensete ventricosum]
HTEGIRSLLGWHKGVHRKKIETHRKIVGDSRKVYRELGRITGVRSLIKLGGHVQVRIRKVEGTTFLEIPATESSPRFSGGWRLNYSYPIFIVLSVAAPSVLAGEPPVPLLLLVERAREVTDEIAERGRGINRRRKNERRSRRLRMRGGKAGGAAGRDEVVGGGSNDARQIDIDLMLVLA